MAGMCFLFRKSGDEIIGQYFEPYTERSICIHGVVNEDIVSGFARQLVFSSSQPVNLDTNLTGDRLGNWNETQHLKLAQGRIVEQRGET